MIEHDLHCGMQQLNLLHAHAHALNHALLSHTPARSRKTQAGQVGCGTAAQGPHLLDI